MQKPKFLLDANLSSETKDYLISLDYQAYAVAEFNLSQAEDKEIFAFAQKKKLIIITLDLDFGQIYYFSSQASIGVIILKLSDQTIESVNKNLSRLLATKILEKRKLQKFLITMDEKKIRIRTQII